MAGQKFKVGETVRVLWLNVFMPGVITSYSPYGKYYVVDVNNRYKDIIYTVREIETWNEKE